MKTDDLIDRLSADLPPTPSAAIPARLIAADSGLYSSIVMPAFSPPLTRLNGRNVGTSIPATTSRGTPMYIGVTM